MPASSPPPSPRLPRVIVLGDLTLDVVLAPALPMAEGTDVPGRVHLRQGGSAANTARWLARAGVRVTLVCAVGRDGAGRALVDAVAADGVRVRAVRVAGRRTGRIGILVGPGGERSFVADRGAADLLAPEDLRDAWFRGVALLHVPAYSLLGEPLGRAGLRATELAHAARALVSVDLASVGPLMAAGRRRALETVEAARPDLLFATLSEARALAGAGGEEALLRTAPIVVIKRGALGASVLHAGAGAGAEVGSGGRAVRARFDVATRALAAADTTGAGDAFDAGFIAAWLAARRDGLPATTALRRATVAGHRLAARHLTVPTRELALG